MSGVLIVTEAPRSLGEFRRRWVRQLDRSYVLRYRRMVARVCARVGGDGATLLTARGFVQTSDLPDGLSPRYYDEETLKADLPALAQRTRRLLESWWPRRETEPALTVDGVWLPDVLSVSKAALLQVDVMVNVGLLERVLDEVKPERVVLVTGQSLRERTARALAEDRGIPTSIAVRFAPASRLAAFARRTLRSRQERLALRFLVDHEQRSPVASAARYLFSVSHARHFTMVNPLARAIQGLGLSCRLIASTTENEELEKPLGKLDKAGIPGAYVMDYLPRDAARRVVRSLRPLSRTLCGAPAVRSPLDSLVESYRRDTLRWSLATAGLYLEAAFRALDAHHPGAVVITSDRRMVDRALALAARRRGIPTLLYWGGAVLGRDRANRFDDVADRVLVLGNHVRKALAEQGVAPTRLVVLGDPRSDEVRRTPPEKLRAQVFADLELDPKRPLVVMISKYVSLLFSHDEKQAFYRTVRDATRTLGGLNVVIKAHPNHENLEVLRNDLESLGWSEITLTREYDIQRLFGAADVALMVTSMAGIEAMALGCPVVAVQTPAKDFEGPGMPPYVSAGAVERVNAGDVEGLTRTLRRLLDDPDARAALAERGRAFAAGYVHPVDGALGERLDALVAALAKERS
jgi:glycosyltransferase involved in cell wall biosynthesis